MPTPKVWSILLSRTPRARCTCPRHGRHLDLARHPWAVIIVRKIARAVAYDPLESSVEVEGDLTNIEPDFSKVRYASEGLNRISLLAATF